MKEAEQKKVHGDGPRMPSLWSFFKTLVLWLAVTVLCLVTWLKKLGSLPASASGIMPLTGMELDAVAWASLGFSLFVLLYKFISLSPTVLPLTALFAAPVSAPHTPLPSPSHLPLAAGHQGPRRDRGVVQGCVYLVSHGHVIAALHSDHQDDRLRMDLRHQTVRHRRVVPIAVANVQPA